MKLSELAIRAIALMADIGDVEILDIYQCRNEEDGHYTAEIWYFDKNKEGKECVML